MLRTVQHLISGTNFYNFSVLHNGNPICYICHHAKVMRNKQHTSVMPLLQLSDQLEYLRLSGNVQSGCWLIGNQYFGLHCQRHRNHRTLTLTTRQFMRVGCIDVNRFRQVHAVYQCNGLLTPVFFTRFCVKANDFVNLLADGHYRIERCHGLLKYH